MIRLRRAVLLAGAAGLLAAPALADTLREALVMAYDTNPTLQSARAQQRAIDEGVPIARAAGLPAASSGASYTEFVDKTASSPLLPNRNFSAGVDLGMPVYAGGGIRNAVRAAETRVVAGQADLRGVESEIFAATVTAYMDVILAEAVVGFSRTNVQRLEVNLQATSDRFEIGDLTRTDVAQSQSRLAQARGSARAAEARLIAARESYIQAVGKAPHNLQAPPALPGLPANPEAAVAVALDNNPDLIAANQRTKAAGFDVKTAGAGRLPRVSVFAGADYSDALNSIKVAGAAQSSTSATAGVQMTIPLFQGGLPAARRRQAQALEGAAIEQAIAVERAVIANVRAAYAQWQAASDVILSSETAVSAAELSLEGVRAENTVGNRTILDILDAENELLDAQVQLATAKRNAYVAGFGLLSAMGKAEARDLGLDGGALYDPQVNYERVRGQIWDWGGDPAPKPQSTRTVDTPAQDGSITRQ